MTLSSKEEIRFLTPVELTRPKKKYCRFRKFGIKYVDYTNVEFLSRFLDPAGKILPRRITGNSQKYQRKVARAIKKARILGLMPYVGSPTLK